MSEPTLVTTNALRNVRVAFSVSESADLGRLGLTAAHCDLAVAELVRAVLLAGGDIVYGGRLKPAGFTEILMDEVLTYAEPRKALTLAVPYTEHKSLSREEFSTVDRRLGLTGELVLLDSNGAPTSHRSDGAVLKDPASALSAMRHWVAQHSDARILLGGKLVGYEGRMPGILEEALASIHVGVPLYVAGGFGGAAAALARRFGYDDQEWAPPDWPRGAAAGPVVRALEEVVALQGNAANDGLTEQQRAQLASSHRPSDIASLVVLGLSRVQESFTTTEEPDNK